MIELMGQGASASFGIEFLAADAQQEALQQAIGQQEEDDLVGDEGKGTGGERLQVAKALQLPMSLFDLWTQAIFLTGIGWILDRRRIQQHRGALMCSIKIKLFVPLAILCWGLALALPSSAAEYPSKPISFILPYPPGGSTDLTARALANAAKKYLGQPIIIENKPGGGATVGPPLLLTKPPDGYHTGKEGGGS